MVDKKEKKVGVEIRGPDILHGKRARLIRGKNEVVGILMANDHQINSKNMTFKYTNDNGVTCISPVTSDEMEHIDEALLDY